MRKKNSKPFPAPVAVALSTLALSGCQTAAHENTAFREFRALEGSSVSVDAKQRFLVTYMRPPEIKNGVVTRIDEVKDATGNVVERRIHRQDGVVVRPAAMVSCAEPSPDALSAFATAASVGLSVQRPTTDVAANIERSIAEAAASIGLRTQSITILRDAMFRMCESYATGAINSDQLARLQRRYQQVMLGLLAIEQITGAVRAPAVALGSDSATDPAREMESAVASYEARVAARDKAREDLGKLQSKHQEIQAESAALDPKIAQAKTDVANKVTGADATLKNLTDDKAALDKEAAAKIAEVEAKATDVKERERDVEAARTLREAVARRIATRSAASADIKDIAAETWQLTPEVAAALAQAAVQIVQQVSTTSFLTETCLELMGDAQAVREFRLDDLTLIGVAMRMCVAAMREMPLNVVGPVTKRATEDEEMKAVVDRALAAEIQAQQFRRNQNMPAAVPGPAQAAGAPAAAPAPARSPSPAAQTERQRESAESFKQVIPTPPPAPRSTPAPAPAPAPARAPVPTPAPGTSPRPGSGPSPG